MSSSPASVQGKEEEIGMLKGVVRFAVLSAVCFCATSASALDMETVAVGHAGNPGDTRCSTNTGFGGVDYTYAIGKYEVTTSQYTDFLNAVAATDAYGLYNESMWSDPTFACKIERSGSPGSFTYSVANDWANRPVNYINWGDAARFCNWLHNGQPTGPQGLGTTEDGAYFLDGAVTDDELLAVTRKSDATWALPTHNEWYKAAYHRNDGVTGNYFDYPTSSDTLPSHDLIDPDPGNNATFFDGEAADPYTIRPYWRTEVGAHENSDSPYGTSDQGGNVWEWTEGTPAEPLRRVWGGSFGSDWRLLHAEFGSVDVSPTLDNVGFGLRVVQVPEPGTIGMLALGALGLLCRRR
jgi:formylglycine-generating enzyme required for sulfatase activity